MIRNKPSTKRNRAAFTVTELVVAASLLTVVIGVVAPLTVHSGQLWRSTRNQQLALEELANQLERITTLNRADRSQAISELAPSAHLLNALPTAALSAEIVGDQHGERLVLSLIVDPRSKPLTLVGWLNPMPDQPETEETTP